MDATASCSPATSDLAETDLQTWREIRRGVILVVRAIVKRYPHMAGLYILFGVDLR